MTALSSRCYAHRSRNGFLVALWVAKNNPEAFSKIDETSRKILLTMLESQANQKLGRRQKIPKIITGKQASLLWCIRDYKGDSTTPDKDELMHRVISYGIDLVEAGYITIRPDDNLESFELFLSPEGEVLANNLNNA